MATEPTKNPSAAQELTLRELTERARDAFPEWEWATLSWTLWKET